MVLTSPCRGPCGDGSFANRERRIWDHGRFSDFVDAAESMTHRASVFRSVGREGPSVEQLIAQLVAGSGVEHAKKFGSVVTEPQDERVAGAPC